MESAILARRLNLLLNMPALLQGEISKRFYERRKNAAKSFEDRSAEFVKYAVPLISAGITPAGGYSGVWCRDASFILEVWLELGLIDQAARWTEWIWSHQISPQSTKFLLGRGSPREFRTRVSKESELSAFRGALPTSIHRGWKEIYASSPDIDSSSLMISLACKVCLSSGDRMLSERLFPQLQNTIKYLESRDIDGDLILEQGPNEDWMDTVMREGKIVYSQGTWLGALKAWALFLQYRGRKNDADRITDKLEQLEKQVDSLLWNGSCYADNCGGRINQDIVFYIKERLLKDTKSARSLKTIEDRLWINPVGPNVVDPIYEKTGPLRLGAYEYHNQAFWPWISSVEVLARQANAESATGLLMKCIDSAAIEWKGRKSGRYPFRTGLAATLIAYKSTNDLHLDEGFRHLNQHH
ncbi:MAG: GH116 family glycosyl hydrolase [Nitrososphaerales archaeon]